jgi:hypothetical protein
MSGRPTVEFGSPQHLHLLLLSTHQIALRPENGHQPFGNLPYVKAGCDCRHSRTGKALLQRLQGQTHVT